MMKVLLCMGELTILGMIMYEVNDDSYGLFMSLLSICEVIGLNMYIELVGLGWDCE